MQRAIFGGSFNPIHWGHLMMAEMALEQASLDQVIWVPTYHPPYKSSLDLVDFHHRLEMVQRAIAAHPQFIASDLEAQRPGPSYAIDTLLALEQRYPQSQWTWLMGLDAFQSLPRWYRHQDLVTRSRWLIAPRFAPRSEQADGNEAKADQDKSVETLIESVIERIAAVTSNRSAEISAKIQWQVLQMPIIGVSSSLVRQYCRDRRSIRYLVPDATRAYIQEQHLYQKFGINS